MGPIRIHVNAALTKQPLWAEYLRQGFTACGDTAEVMRHPRFLGDSAVTVVLGPHFCGASMPGRRVLRLDRAYWGDPDCVSLGWQEAGGTYTWALGQKARPVPKLAPLRVQDGSCLLLLGYNEIIKPPKFPRLYVRHHPASTRRLSGIDALDDCSLAEALSHATVAVGRYTTALVDAALAGLHIVAPSDSCVGALVAGENRALWLHRLSYRQFSAAEVQDGTAWRLLRDC